MHKPSEKHIRNLFAVFLLFLILPLSGCYDRVDLAGEIFAINLALDKGSDQNLRLTAQYPEITPVGKQSDESGSDHELSQSGYTLTQVEGDSMRVCLERLQLVTPRTISLMQLRGIFVSKELTEDYLFFYECLSLLDASNDIRPAAQVYLTRCSAEDALRNDEPMFGARLSKSQAAQGEVLRTLGVIPSSPLNLFFQHLTDSCRSAVAVLTDVNSLADFSMHGESRQAMDFLAGDAPRYSVSPIEQCGSAVFGGQEVLMLTGYETQLCNLLNGDLRELPLTLDDRTVQIKLPKTPKKRVILDADGKAELYVKLTLDCDLPEPEPFYRLLQRDLVDLLLKLQAASMDPVDFTDLMRQQVLTFSDWESLNWPQKYRSATLKVEYVSLR